ncbi:GNAT family N-acetyltransferase [Enhygromyxa salina]|uniref:Putative acetyltransferase n=1 Tax=Enhygromyxa salina TaxID=215803 RepID=A0A2S9YJF4_9BACT|nr:GNAT family N-acetyltransferase [Enhygromyxa salina]PRQ05235.1 putative acetyltransferase [Enhygromyxa salina]
MRTLDYATRLATAAEASSILAIEDAAGRKYAEAGLPGDLDGLDPSVVAASITAGTLWVVVDRDDRPVGFALCQIRGDALHLRELDVHPDHMRQGLGRRLVELVSERAATSGLARVTLTTFRDVAWNAPLYRRWGFATLEPDAQPGWLVAVRAEEDRGELRRWPRVAMARPI